MVSRLFISYQISRKIRETPSHAMTAQVVAFRTPKPAFDREGLVATLPSLHTLITIDPILGASPVRIYFVLNPQAVGRIVENLDPFDRSNAHLASLFAVIAYDFPFALHLIESSAPHIPPERARSIATHSAGLQGDSLMAAARTLGIEAHPVLDFNAEGLKNDFFPTTQETVTQLFWLEPMDGPNVGPTR